MDRLGLSTDRAPSLGLSWGVCGTDMVSQDKSLFCVRTCGGDTASQGGPEQGGLPRRSSWVLLKARASQKAWACSERLLGSESKGRIWGPQKGRCKAGIPQG